MALKEGWRGRVFEDFEVGDVYVHPLGRTVTTTDNLWFTLLTQNTNPIHFDHSYAARTEFKRPLVDSTYTLLDQEQKHARILANAGATSPYTHFYFPATTFASLGFTSRVGTCLWVLDHLETAFIGAYIAAVRRFGELARPDLATVALRFLGVECQHRALYRAIARDDPADNITLEVAQFAHVSDAAVALTPFLTAKGFSSGATGAIAIPAQDQIMRAVGKNTSL